MSKRTVPITHSFEPHSLEGLALANYGHFTTMHVADGRVRGLRLHVERLVRDCRAVFAVGIDETQVRAVIVRAVEAFGATGVLRVTLFAPGFDIGRPTAAPEEIAAHAVMRPAPAGPLPPLRVKTVAYSREQPKVKHVGLFGALHHRRGAQLEGFDDVVFIGADSTVCEGSTWNIGFIDDDAVVWPTASILPGVTMTLLREAHGPAKTRRVPRADLAGMQAAFATNAAYGVRAITGIDDHVFGSAHPLLASLRAAYDTLPADPVAPPMPRSIGARPTEVRPPPARRRCRT